MASEAELAALIQLGHDITSLKYLSISVTALWAYDYFLTLKDEIRYAWKTESILIFVLFLFSRYLPVLFQVWTAVSHTYPGYTSEMCKETAFLQVLYITFITTVAQIVLTQRTYAITNKNKWIPGILYTISATQFGVGLYLVVWSALNTEQLPVVPLDSYQLCVNKASKHITILQISLSLLFDVVVLAFVLVRTQLFASTYQGMKTSNILGTVARDTKIYFAMISTAHLLIVIMFVVARPGLRIMPIVGNSVFIPMMITRTIISVKKAASSRKFHMSGTEVSAGFSVDQQDTHPPRLANDIQLSVFKS